jgi:hypothetical protein
MRSSLTVVAYAAALTGCASQLANSSYVRTDGAAVNAAQEQATLAQCKAEGVTTVPSEGPDQYPWNRARDEATIINACMARNGYIKPQ